MKLLGRELLSSKLKNLQILAIQVNKVSKVLSPHLLCDVFKLISEQRYNLRQSFQCFTPRVSSVYCGTGVVSFLGPKFWDLVPNELKVSFLAPF